MLEKIKPKTRFRIITPVTRSHISCVSSYIKAIMALELRAGMCILVICDIVDILSAVFFWRKHSQILLSKKGEIFNVRVNLQYFFSSF